MYVTLVQMCPLYTSHSFPREHVYCEEDPVFVLFVFYFNSFFVSLSVYHHSLWHVLQKTSHVQALRQGEYFLPGTVVYCESLFSAL